MRAPRLLWIVLSALFCLPAAFAGDGGALLGSWRLREQTYGEGRHDFADPAERLLLRFERSADGEVAAGVLWQGRPLPWPSYPTPAGPARVELLERTIAPELGSARARYRVPPAPGDDTWLRVDERCTASGEDELRCELTIAFERGGRTRGGFTWHRVFAREDGP